MFNEIEFGLFEKCYRTQTQTAIMTSRTIISITSFMVIANLWWSHSGESDNTRNTMNPVVENANNIKPIDKRQTLYQNFKEDIYHI